jgi:hypothetical protein
MGMGLLIAQFAGPVVGKCLRALGDGQCETVVFRNGIEST